MLDYIKPNLIFTKLRDIYRETLDYLVFRKEIKRLEAEGKFREVNLRVTNWGAAYFGLNLPPELLLYQREGSVEFQALELQRVKEALKMYNEFYTNNLLIDFVTTGYERVKTEDFYGYLIWIDFNYVYLKYDNLKQVGKQVLINVLGYTAALTASIITIAHYL